MKILFWQVDVMKNASLRFSQPPGITASPRLMDALQIIADNASGGLNAVFRREAGEILSINVMWRLHSLPLSSKITVIF